MPRWPMTSQTMTCEITHELSEADYEAGLAHPQSADEDVSRHLRFMSDVRREERERREGVRQLCGDIARHGGRDKQRVWLGSERAGQRLKHFRHQAELYLRPLPQGFKRGAACALRNNLMDRSYVTKSLISEIRSAAAQLRKNIPSFEALCRIVTPRRRFLRRILLRSA